MVKNFIFDWSGVISNDFINVYKATALSFFELGLKSISITEFNRVFRLPYMDFWHKFVPGMTPEEKKDLYLRAWDKLPPPRIFPGVKYTLTQLRNTGKKLIVLSSHDNVRLLREAKPFEIEGLFQEINGSVLNKVDSINGIMKRNGFNPNETMFVGDMTHDIDAGKAAGVITTAILWRNARFLYEPLSEIIIAEPDNIIFDIWTLL